MVLLRRLHWSLLAVQLVGAATLLRSLAYDRWITVLASVLLILGATAAKRGRSWGVALTFGAALAFPVAWAIGIAPAWFCLVGLVGSLPFALAAPSFARFDKGAATLLGIAAASVGALGAIVWKELAWPLFTMFPSIRPSIEAQHVGGLAALAAIVALVVALRPGRGSRAPAPTRIAEQVRVGVGLGGAESSASRDTESMVEAEVPHTDEDAYEPRRMSR